MKKSFTSSRLLAFSVATALHAAFLAQVFWSASLHRPTPPDTQGVGASARSAQAPPSSTLVLIQLPQPTSDLIAEEVASAGESARDQAVVMISPDAAPAIRIDPLDEHTVLDAAAAAEVESAAVRAMFFTRYTGQIDARILRAWRRPRTAVNAAKPDETFDCRVSISQDREGNVLEVQLVRCNGTIAWQRSLVAAIDRASPLPAPPRPSVFSNVISMSFTAIPYSKGLPEDAYELPTTRVGTVDAPPSLDEARAL